MCARSARGGCGGRYGASCGGGCGAAAAAASNALRWPATPSSKARGRRLANGGGSRLRLPKSTALFRRYAEFHRFLIVFSARPGRSMAMRVHALPQRSWALARMESSSAVQPPLFRLGSTWFVQRSRHCLPVRPAMRLETSSQDGLGPDCMHWRRTSSSASVKAPFTRPERSTRCQRCSQSSADRDSTARAAAAQSGAAPGAAEDVARRSRSSSDLVQRRRGRSKAPRILPLR
mmetsp:Transcript_20546/g.69662  ORF Transcript_20546/g.69662 Transcript_20546/m.69662 type:complete len:233 (-) Transcript_20546:79-777(-)